MYVLSFKHKNGESYHIGISNNYALFSEVVKAYNHRVGYIPQVGMYSQDVDGCLTIQKMQWYGPNIEKDTFVDFKLINEILEKVMKLC